MQNLTIQPATMANFLNIEYMMDGISHTMEIKCVYIRNKRTDIDSHIADSLHVLGCVRDKKHYLDFGRGEVFIHLNSIDELALSVRLLQHTPLKSKQRHSYRNVIKSLLKQIEGEEVILKGYSFVPNPDVEESKTMASEFKFENKPKGINLKMKSHSLEIAEAIMLIDETIIEIYEHLHNEMSPVRLAEVINISLCNIKQKLLLLPSHASLVELLDKIDVKRGRGVIKSLKMINRQFKKNYRETTNV